MSLVHFCPFCGWHRPAESATMLEPHCDDCGGTLRPAGAEEHRLMGLEGDGPAGPEGHLDATAGIALIVMLPWLLPLVGVQLSDIAFAPALALMVFAAHRLWCAAFAVPSWRAPLLALAAASAASAVASCLTIAEAVALGRLGTASLYVGGIGSIGLLLGAGLAARRSLTAGGWAQVVDAALLALVAVGLVVLFVVVPGFRDGDPGLTAIVLIDLGAFVLAGLAAVARVDGTSRRALWWLTAACAAALVGDCAAAAARDGASASAMTVAACWAVAGFALAVAGDHALDATTGPRRGAGNELGAWRLVCWRVLAPLAAVLAMPATAAVLALQGRLTTWAGVWCAALTLLALGLAFGRQGHVLLERQRAVVRERRLRREATRRNDELEALTGLATTMTQTLEEAPIVEQALGVLATAARATSAALHVATAGGERLAAASGAWEADREWRPRGAVGGREVTRRGGREMLRLPLAARGQHIGTVTLVRRQDEPFDANGVELLRLLVDQMAVAVQNARDYREKLEQAISDPLTGAYNRRYLLEALEKEVQRTLRYGSEASLVIFDVDDFKAINDTYGHAAGDDVLRAIARTVQDLLRPVDSFARIGGEEFALLLPQTTQFEALLVADRVRAAVARQTIVADRRVTLSGGIASIPADATTAEDLQRQADAALYWAKRNGKDLCAVAREVADDAPEDAPDRLVAHLYALVAMIDAAELHTRDHSENVATYALALGRELSLPRDRLLKLRRAAMLHDVGKVAVRSEVLAKPAALTDEEFAAIREHPVVGGTMLAHAGLLEEADWVRHHHERFDGRGYPDGLAGEAVPLEARILFVADAFEAITSHRPYSAATDSASALDELRRCAGTQFDPVVVAALGRLLDEDRLPVLALGV